MNRRIIAKRALAESSIQEFDFNQCWEIVDFFPEGYQFAKNDVLRFVTDDFEEAVVFEQRALVCTDYDQIETWIKYNDTDHPEIVVDVQLSSELLDLNFPYRDRIEYLKDGSPLWEHYVYENTEIKFLFTTELGRGLSISKLIAMFDSEYGIEIVVYELMADGLAFSGTVSAPQYRTFRNKIESEKNDFDFWDDNDNNFTFTFTQPTTNQENQKNAVQ